MNKKISSEIAFGIILILAVVVGVLIWPKNDKQSEQKIETKSNTSQSASTNASKDTSYNNLIRVDFPKAGEKVGGTINIVGTARGTWYFEGEFPIDLIDLAGNKLGSASALAEGEWMTENFVPFSVAIKYTVIKSTEAKLIIQKNNPSDLEENNASFEIPVTLEPEISSSKVFFPSNHLNPSASGCDKVFPVVRITSESMAIARQAVEKLLEGPTEQEIRLGYWTVIPKGVKIQQFDASSKIARIDLSRELLNLKVDTACPRIYIVTQLEKTIKDSSGAEKVIITVDEKPFPGKFPNEGPE